MTVKSIIDEALKLPHKEQMKLLDELSRLFAPETAEDIYLTPEQAADLDMRIEEAESGKAKFVPGDEAVARIRNRT